MNMQSNDWKGEHLIRKPKPPVEAAPTYKEKLTQQQIDARAARERDAATIRALAVNMTRAEIRIATGLSTNRVYEICQDYNIKPLQHDFRARKGWVR